MATATLEARVDSFETTDSMVRGCDAHDLVNLTTEFTVALNGAIWSYMLRAELEDAFDTALLRAAFAETPTLTGAGLFTA
jgi:hypothetical protein